MSDDKNSSDGKNTSQNEESQDNVIRFPVERVKSKRKLKKLAGKMGDNRKATLFLSLLSVMVMSGYLLQGLNEQTREIASSDNRDISKEVNLANRLLNPDNRAPASYGRRPSSEEFLRRDLTNYNFKHDEGYLYLAQHQTGEKVVLSALHNDEGALDSFLMRYRDYIYPSYDEVKADYEFEGMNPRSVYYELFKDGESTGHFIEFELEPEGPGIDSIKVQAIRKP